MVEVAKKGATNSATDPKDQATLVTSADTSANDAATTPSGEAPVAAGAGAGADATKDVHFNTGFQTRLHHTSQAHIDRLNSVIIKSTLVGGLYGALISIPSELLIRWRSPLYRAFGFRIRVFYHTIWIASAAAFHAEQEVIAFENKIRAEEALRRKKLLELSIVSGQYTSGSELSITGKR